MFYLKTIILWKHKDEEGFASIPKVWDRMISVSFYSIHFFALRCLPLNNFMCFCLDTPFDKLRDLG